MNKFILLLCSAAILSSCIDLCGNSQEIHGKWKNGRATVEFSCDGTYTNEWLLDDFGIVQGKYMYNELNDTLYIYDRVYYDEDREITFHFTDTIRYCVSINGRHMVMNNTMYKKIK